MDIVNNFVLSAEKSSVKCTGEQGRYLRVEYTDEDGWLERLLVGVLQMITIIRCRD